MTAKQMCQACGHCFVLRADDGLMRIHQVPNPEKGSHKYLRCPGSLLPPLSEAEIPRQAFEYRSEGGKLLTAGELNEYGADGWEMCGLSEKAGYIYYFKRPQLTLKTPVGQSWPELL